MMNWLSTEIMRAIFNLQLVTFYSWPFQDWLLSQSLLWHILTINKIEVPYKLQLFIIHTKKFLCQEVKRKLCNNLLAGGGMSLNSRKKNCIRTCFWGPTIIAPNMFISFKTISGKNYQLIWHSTLITYLQSHKMK